MRGRSNTFNTSNRHMAPRNSSTRTRRQPLPLPQLRIMRPFLRQAIHTPTLAATTITRIMYLLLLERHRRTPLRHPLFVDLCFHTTISSNSRRRKRLEPLAAVFTLRISKQRPPARLLETTSTHRYQLRLQLFQLRRRRARPLWLDFPMHLPRQT